ncbi:hypothetical protein SADUNF_Sadunf11G0019700 [Salix dunnii]|uniref:Uncharacterized protein n=1 Tax=Salix dunnii TaxID=1413687 RepID=A0A835JPK8_9ROSI|nr:hypothetical protein SADUNF_Sadunf11G0019700 [Salix dunnii]
MVDHSGFLKLVTWHASDHKWKEFWAAPSTCHPGDITRYECACLPGMHQSNTFPEHLLPKNNGGCVSKGLEYS